MDSVMHNRPARRKGFTLIEILVVLAIMMIMMGMAMFAFVDWGRGAKLRTAVTNFRTAFTHTRQHTVTHRRRTALLYGNAAPPGSPPGTPPNRGWYAIANPVDGLMGVTNYLPEGIIITNEPGIDSWALRFKLDGSCDSDCDDDGSSGDDWTGNQRKILLIEGGRGTNALIYTVQVFRLTGTIQKSE
jgi:prepilin-type N-terminal cleavage/methylation domain-containing protein